MIDATITRASLIVMLLIGAALAGLPLFVPVYYVELATSGLIAAMLALGLQVLVGCTGLVSLGHGAFYGLAAYTVYLITPDGAGMPIWITMPVAVVTAGLAALVVGALSLRTRGFFFLMVTLAFGQMIFFVFHDTKLGGGADGAYFTRPLIAAFGFELELPRRQRPFGIYYIALIQLAITYLIVLALMRTLFGRALTGIRINEHRLRALGFDTYRYKLASFVIAGMLAGAAGHMWALHRALVNPELVGWHRSAEALLMILLGGLNSLAGPVIGAFAWTALGEIAPLITERKLLVEGLVILAVVLFLPGGLVSLWPKGQGRRDPEVPVAAPDPSDPVPLVRSEAGGVRE